MVSFRKSKKFGPFRLTASTRGLSASAGVPGARATINTRGEVRRTFSVPGAGFYDTNKIATLGRSAKGQASKVEDKDLFQLEQQEVLQVGAQGGIFEVPEGTKYIQIQPAKGLNLPAKIWMAIALVAISLWVVALIS